MNDLLRGFKDCAHQAAEKCRIPIGKLIGTYGLGDFLENKIAGKDEAPEIVIKALEFFCEEPDPHMEIFRFGVLVVVLFLDQYHSGTPGGQPRRFETNDSGSRVASQETCEPRPDKKVDRFTL